jgi:hypothetical protein
LTLGGNGRAAGATDDRADHCPTPAVQYSTQDCPGSTADDCSAYWILCGRIPHRRDHCNC